MALVTVGSCHMWLSLKLTKMISWGFSFQQAPFWTDFLGGPVPEEIGEGVNPDQPQKGSAGTRIDNRGGVQSAALLKLAESLWVLASEHLFALRAFHVPGLENKAPTSCPEAILCEMIIGYACLWWSRIRHGLGEWRWI